MQLFTRMGQFGFQRPWEEGPPSDPPESTLPSRELTDEQLEDWEAEHGAAPPGSHPSRPWEPPAEPDVTEPQAAAPVPPTPEPVTPPAPSTVVAPVPTATEVQAPFPTAPVTAVPPAPGALDPGPFTPPPPAPLSDAEFQDQYSSKIDAFGQMGERYTGTEMLETDLRDEVADLTETVLSDVPSEDRARLIEMAKEEYPDYASLERERDYWPRAEERRLQREARNLPREVQTQREIYEEFPGLTTPSYRTPSRGTVTEFETPDSVPVSRDAAIPASMPGGPTSATSGCPPGTTPGTGGACLPDVASGLPMTPDMGPSPAATPLAPSASAPVAPAAPAVPDAPLIDVKTGVSGVQEPTLGVPLRLATPMSGAGFLGQVPVRSGGF